MAEILLTAETGRPTGSSAARRLRAEGKVPAVVYGPGTEAVPVAVVWRELRAALTTDKGTNALITLDLGKGNKRQAVIKELQRHPVRRDVLHIDFFEVDPDQPITTDVTIVLEGEAEAVLREQGVVEQTMNAIVVSGKPNAIPGHLAVDVSGLEIGHTITVADLELPSGVTTEVDAEETVVTAQLTSAAMIEDVEAAEAEAAEASAEATEGEEGEGGEAASAEGESSGEGESESE
jgi:large subunit ribosomal protein L25